MDNNLVMGKALDNRVGCAILIEVLKQVESEATLYGVGTVQEEVGLKGAKTSAFGINPDMALALDVTISGDHPGIKEEDAPARRVKDRLSYSLMLVVEDLLLIHKSKNYLYPPRKRKGFLINWKLVMGEPLTPPLYT